MLKILRVLLIIACGGFFILGFSRIAIILSTQAKIVEADISPAKPVVIVPGAGLNADGTPSTPLRDRVEAAAELYFAGKAQKILMSGDNRFINYNEPESMRQYALTLGVPDEDIVLDYAGRSTYDTCYRAKAIFGVEEALIVTQAYHLPRAVYLCDHLGVKITGVPVEQSRYVRSRYLFWNIREAFASMAAVWDIHIAKPLPVLGEPEPIFK